MFSAVYFTFDRLKNDFVHAAVLVVGDLAQFVMQLSGNTFDVNGGHGGNIACFASGSGKIHAHMCAAEIQIGLVHALALATKSALHFALHIFFGNCLALVALFASTGEGEFYFHSTINEFER